MMWSKRSKYLKAASLVESVLAIAIISICVLVSFLIYLNVMKQNDALKLYEAHHKIELLHLETLAQESLDDERFNFKYYTINKTVDLLRMEKLAYITYTIKIKKKTAAIKKVVIIDDENEL